MKERNNSQIEILKAKVGHDDRDETDDGNRIYNSLMSLIVYIINFVVAIKFITFANKFSH